MNWRLSILQTKAENARVPVPIQVRSSWRKKISTNITRVEGAPNASSSGQMLGR